MNELKQLFLNPVGRDYLTLSYFAGVFVLLSLFATLIFLHINHGAYAAFTISVTVINIFNCVINYRVYRKWKKSNNK
jgi:hypothetical protein